MKSFAFLSLFVCSLPHSVLNILAWIQYENNNNFEFQISISVSLFKCHLVHLFGISNRMPSIVILCVCVCSSLCFCSFYFIFFSIAFFFLLWFPFFCFCFFLSYCIEHFFYPEMFFFNFDSELTSFSDFHSDFYVFFFACQLNVTATGNIIE